LFTFARENTISEALKKFRKKGNKDGALRAFYKIEEEGLGNVLKVASAEG
jgi:ribosomal protein S21